MKSIARRIGSLARLVVVASLLGIPAFSVWGDWVAAPGTVKMFVRKKPSDPRLGGQRPAPRLDLLAPLGAQVIDDRETFVMLQLPLANASAAATILRESADVVEELEEYDLLTFSDTPVDARLPVPAYSPPWNRSAPLPAPLRDVFVLQFATVPRTSWVRDLESSGVTVLEHIPYNGYLVMGNEASIRQAVAHLPVQLLRLHQPFHRVESAVRSAGDPFLDVAVSIAGVPEAAEALSLLDSMSLARIRAVESGGDRTHHYVTVETTRLPQLAALPAVLWVEKYEAPKPSGQREVHLTIGDTFVTNFGSPPVLRPALGDHRAWLAARGLSNYKARVGRMAILETGFDVGSSSDVHRDFRDGSAQSFVEVKPYVATPQPPPPPGGWDADCYGHGTGVAGVLAGNAGNVQLTATQTRDIGSSYGDADYLMGLGILPEMPIVVGRIWNGLQNSAGPAYDPKDRGQIYADLLSEGVTIASNSYNFSGDPSYTIESQLHDKLVRSATGGNGGPQMAIYFSAGNAEGQAAGQLKVSAPGTAKNVITVGASENFNPVPYPEPTQFNPSATGGTFSDNGNHIWSLSQEATTPEGRLKPDIVAPGSAIEFPRTRQPFNCRSDFAIAPVGTLIDPASPAGEQHYWSRGTSFSAPLAAGAGALLYTWYKNVFAGSAPTPAMLKAMQVALTRDLFPGTGHPPDTRQGWGKADLERAFATDGRYVWSDEQSNALMTTSGQATFLPSAPFSRYRIKDTSKPVRVAIAWTDAPGPTGSGVALKNNLDLTVRLLGGAFPKYVVGNDFNPITGRSNIRTSGGSYDLVNNVEQVVFSFGDAGGDHFVVEVFGRTISADAIDVWSNPPSTNFRQNVALFIENAEVVFSQSGPFSFHTLQPCRVLDTRDPAGPYGGPILSANLARVVGMWGRCGIPNTAKAVAANFTVIGALGLGHLTAYPANIGTPAVSTMNYIAGMTRSNNAVLILDSLGAVALYAAQSGTHVALDVNGYFE